MVLAWKRPLPATAVAAEGAAVDAGSEAPDA